MTSRAPLLLLMLAALQACAARGRTAANRPASSQPTGPAGLSDLPPAPGPAPALVLPFVSRHRLSNGMEVWIAAQHALPRVAMALAIRGGSEAEQPAQAGLAALCADLIDEGTASRSALAVAEAFADEGAQVDVSASYAGTVLRVWSLSEPKGLERVVGLLGELASHPRFAKTEFARVRSDRLTEVAARRDDPAVIASLALSSAIYGREHPYGIPVDGRSASLRALRLSDVKSYWRRTQRPDAAALVAVGAIEPTEFLAMLEATFAEWRAPSAPPAARHPAPVKPGPRLVIVDRPGATQSELRLGHVGLARGHRDEYVAEVLSTLLGGAFASRLNNRLREQLGYTYGAWAGFALRREPGPFMMGAAVRTDVTTAAVREFASELARLRDEEPSTQELLRARDGLLRGLPARLEGASAMTAELANLFLHNMPSDYFSRFAERVSAVTAQDVHRAAAEHLHPEQLHIAVVGDRGAIEGELLAAGFGPAARWNADGDPLP